MAGRQWTTEQRQCIDARGGTVLVSAAAGSGKTSVLVERVITRVTDGPSPIDIDRLLVVTFTNAAAAEMKQRLSAALTARMAEHPEDIRLQRQQMLLARANISTVHGFCSTLLREQFHLLGLPPQFRVAEAAETAQLAEDTVSDVVEELYQENHPAFRDLTALLSPGKDDRGLFAAILRIHGFVQSHPFPDQWLNDKQDIYAADLPMEQTPWGQVVLQQASDMLQSAASLLLRALELALEEPAMADKYADTLRREHAMLKTAAGAVLSSAWDVAQVNVAGLTFSSLPALRKYEDESRKERVKALRDKAKDTVTKKLPPLFCGSEEDCRDDIRAMAGLAAVLFDAVRRFDTRFADKKRERGLIDFNDLEHFALHLLVDAQGRKTPLAQELSGRFDEVMVDEYQDTNAAQDALFRALSRDETNLFMVGDVKQSIYGFRQAMPDIFLGRRDSYPPYDAEHFPASITLGNNFRSRPQVTDAVNFVFRQVMTKSVCGMDYDEREELIPSASYPPAEGCDTELLVVDGGTREETDGTDAAEARVIAARIRDMMANFHVTDKDGCQRPPKYGDFCILLRSKNAHAQGYADELTRCGIPVYTAAAGGFFASAEVASAISLLRVIDNPVQDVPLLSALVSPAFGFTPDDLAEIRLHDRDSRLFTALRRYARGGDIDELRGRVAAFLEQIDRWRVLAVTLPADQLIHRLFEDAALPSIAGAMRHGEQRVANLRLIHDTARRFEQKGFRGLSAFVKLLDRAERQDSEFSAAPPAGAEDAVRIISIHHSKGLEFPIVFLAGLGRQFNRESTTDNLLLHADKGVGFKRRDSETLRQWNTLPRQAVALTITRSERAEELRVLYVAMTRAKEKLCMVMTLPNPESKLASLAAMIGGDDVLPAHAVLGAGGMGDWILYAALRHPSGRHLRALAGDDGVPVRPADFPWHIDVLRSPQAEEREAGEQERAEADKAFVAEIARRMAYTYPYAALSALPSKLAASALSHGQIRRDNVATARPAFMSEGGLTPAERGTALHTFMQFADYATAAAAPQDEVTRLVREGFLTGQQGAVIPLPRVRRFFGSDLYRRMRQADRLLREVHFAVDIPAAELLDSPPPLGAEDETLVIQGIADCVLEERDTLTVVDYKTDRVSTPDVLVERYVEQLRIYTRALERTIGLPVRQCLLYSFALDMVIDATAAVRQEGISSK